MVPQVKGGTPGGGTMVMTQGESVEYPCTTDFTCLIMAMLFGGALYLSSFVFIFHPFIHVRFHCIYAIHFFHLSIPDSINAQ